MRQQSVVYNRVDFGFVKVLITSEKLCIFFRIKAVMQCRRKEDVNTGYMYPHSAKVEKIIRI